MEKEYVLALVFVISCALFDLKVKKIPSILLLGFGAVSVVFWLTAGTAGWKEAIYALVPGAAMLALGLCTKESIGYGDGFAVLVLGFLTGMVRCLAAVFIGFLLAAVCGLLLLALKKVNGKSRLPYMPFLAAGLGVVLYGPK